MRFTLDDPPFANRTGQGVRVAVVDSGIAAGHVHVGSVAEAVVVGSSPSDVSDRIGHGTAVAAAIREKAPDVELVSVKVFHHSLATNATMLAEGIARSVALGARLINLSLGTANAEHEALLLAAVAAAARQGAIIVSASESGGTRWLPGALPEVAGIVADWDCARDAIVWEPTRHEGLRLLASAFPRPIPGVPKERNLSGVSFAVANATGFLARLLQDSTTSRGLIDVTNRLREARPS